MKTCGAATRSGGKCKNKAGYKTDHPGEGKCKFHGGATPIKHGLNSTVHASRLGDLIEKHKQNPDPLNLLHEVAQLRAFAEDLMQRWETIYGVDGALLAWHNSYTLGDGIAAKPRQLPDFSAVGSIVDKVGAMVDRIQKHRQEQSVSLATLNRILEQFGIEVVVAVKGIGLDEPTSSRLLKSIEARWGAIRILPDSPSAARPA